MARYIGPVCRLCRREQVKLFLKGEKCYTKCVLENRPTPPGVAKPQRGKPSEYAIEIAAPSDVASPATNAACGLCV